MNRAIKVGDRYIGDDHPTYIIGEIGINHNGDLAIARKLIDAAVLAGCDAVKFQKRTPELCVPHDQRERMRDTPWGRMTYMDYRYRVEFGVEEYEDIDAYCKEKGIQWLASCWDEEAVEFMEQFNPPFYKMASASLTDHSLLGAVADTGRPMMISTGMSTMDEIRQAVAFLGARGVEEGRLMIAHSTSSYPCPPEELNLRMIQTLRNEFDHPIGYSGHEVGLQTTYAAVVLGASFLERHITLDRAMWGSDQAASVEPWGLMRLVRDVRAIEKALGDGVKHVYDSEVPIMNRLRRTPTRA